MVFHARRCLQEFAYETLKSQFTVDVGTFNHYERYAYTQPADNVVYYKYQQGVPHLDVTMTETTVAANPDTGYLRL